MGNVELTLKEAMGIDGAIAVALGDYESGMSLGALGGSAVDLDVAVAGNTEVIRAKLRTMHALNLDDQIEDILITLGTQYHLIRLLQSTSGRGLFLYLVLAKNRANLAMARRRLGNLESALTL
jgi:hypothetical protein